MTGGRLLVAALVVLLTSACASGDEQPTARTSGQQASPSTRPSTSASAGGTASSSASPSASPTATLEDSPCRVKGFRPSGRQVLRSQRRTTLYAAGLDLGPGVTARGATRLQKLGDTTPGVLVVQPADASVDAAILRRVGAGIEGASPSPLPGEFFVRRRVSNTSSRTRLYAEYVAAKVYRGTWTARACGGVLNDGTSVTTVRGTFVSIGLTDSGVLPCEDVTSGRAAWVRRLATVCD